MKELKQEIAKLERSCRLAQDELKKMYEGRKEGCVLHYIQENVKQGDIFWLFSGHPYREELEFKELRNIEIVFWNKTFNKENIFTPYGFLNLEKE